MQEPTPVEKKKKKGWGGGEKRPRFFFHPHFLPPCTWSHLGTKCDDFCDSFRRMPYQQLYATSASREKRLGSVGPQKVTLLKINKTFSNMCAHLNPHVREKVHFT
ncbi:hypothetical protein CEXT_390541 [Caerostris extrusa]|uniref:Uncharacterized protein n=1 Tax=Caerostris extrusa TaxID=172846 RepID=A0AAV4YBA2_CAEEX|nr:hypothetical protein CEXT_390541 [Caerostris extrusa]